MESLPLLPMKGVQYQVLLQLTALEEDFTLGMSRCVQSTSCAPESTPAGHSMTSAAQHLTALLHVLQPDF